MPDINDVQEAMRKWHEAHTAMLDFYEEKNILESSNFPTWQALRAAEEQARIEADALIAEAHAA